MSNLLSQELEYQDVYEYFWTDSKVVLGYIRNDAKRFHVYVANRVQRIRETTQPEQWHYIDTKENPADHASRGLNANELMSSNWFTGPSFLWENVHIPTEQDSEYTELCSDDPEVRQVCAHALKSAKINPILNRITHFSDWSRAINGIALLKRFISRRKENDPPFTTTTEENRKDAEMMIIKLVQSEFYSDEINQIRSGISKNSKLYKLDPFLDEKGILRVGGRLAQAPSLHHLVKHPVILPRKSHVTDLVIKHCHEKVAHQGRGITVNTIRYSGFWVIGISAAVSSHIYKCYQCRKLRGQPQDQKMANLPQERLDPSPPFTYCGFDCFGPFLVKDGRKELKKYGLLFTCTASRAVHIETLDDLTTDAFINALRCFIALRGMVRQLQCDQGSNFIGANRELKRALEEVKENKVRNFLANHGCDFVFNVPSASHMGGIWERQIRTIRSILNSILHQFKSRLDTSSLRTFLYETMAIINSRPLTTDNLNDPYGLEALTPNHFLTMKSGIVMPPPGNFQEEDVYARKRWRCVQYLTNQFWLRWKKEYLTNLQVRQKWNKVRRNIEVGDIVLLREENLVRNHWKLARVEEIIPSKDNLVRKVKILVADHTLTKEGKRVKGATYLERPIHKLTLLVENQKNT